MDRELKEITENEFRPLVLENEGLSLVEFGAPWCPPCKALLPTLKQIDAQFAERVRVYTVNTDVSLELAAQYKIRGLPIVILFKRGKIVDQLYGKQSLAAYQTAIGSSLTNG